MRMMIVVLALASGGCEFLLKAKKECDASIAQQRDIGDAPPTRNFSGRWSCIYEGTDGANGTERLDISQSGSRITASSRDGYNNAAVLDGRVAGNMMVLTRGGSNLTVRVQGDTRMLDGTIDSGFSNDCAQRRYTCNRR